MASNKSRQHIPVGRQQSGIFPKRNPLQSFGSLTSQPTKRSISSNRLDKKKSVQLNAPNKSRTSLISKKFSVMSNFSKNRENRSDSPSNLSMLSMKKDSRTKKSFTRMPKKSDDRRRRNVNPLTQKIKEESKDKGTRKTSKNDDKKSDKDDTDILEVYKIEQGYAESEIPEDDDFLNPLVECGDAKNNEGTDHRDNSKHRQPDNSKFSITSGTGHKICKDFITYVEQIRLESPGDGGHFRERCLHGLKSVEEKINAELARKKNELDAYAQKMKHYSNKKPDVGNAALVEELEKEKIQLNLCIEAYKSKLDESEKKLHQVQEIPKQIVQELQATIEEQDKEIQRILNINKCLEEHKKGVDMKNEVLLRELSQCEIRISQCKGENQNLKENLTNMRTRTYQEIENDYKELLESQNSQREKMKKQLTDNYRQIDELKDELDAVRNKHIRSEENQSNQLAEELNTLNLKYKELEKQYELVLNENKKGQDIKCDVDKIKSNYDETITKLKKERDEAIIENDELRNALTEKEEILENFELSKSDDQTDRLRQEVHRLHLQNTSIQQEHEELKKTALRLRVECRAAEETNIMNQRLLKIRGELIKYFHESKDKCSIHDIYPGLSKSSAANDSEIFMRDSKVSLNFNDLQKLSSTLDSKDTDIASKCHMIRYLEDNENRYKRTISKLRDYTSRLESENAELKRLLRMDSQIS